MTTQETQISKFEPQKAIEQVKSKVAPFVGLTIKDLNDKEGYEKVRVALSTCVSTRTEFVATCKEARDEANKYSKFVIEQEKIGVEEILKVENELRAAKEKIDEEKEAIKQEKERKALAALQIRIDALSAVGYAHDSFELRLMEDADYQKLLAEKTEAFRISEEKRIADQEKARKDAEELEAFRKRQAEIEAKEKALKDAEEKAQREKEEAERIKQAEEKARIETEERIKREQAEKEAKEKAEQEAKLQAEKAEQERLEKMKKYQSWLTENGFTKETESEFTVMKNAELGEIYLYKKVSTFKI